MALEGCEKRLLLDFDSPVDNQVFRLGLAAVMLGVFSAAQWDTRRLLEGQLAKRGLQGWTHRYAVVLPGRLLLLPSPAAAFPRDVVSLAPDRPPQ
ncbi:uncharacterized protein HaLaN_08043 [Haematococcus lacustris]|uniref:Uncharacterized protein n=1 Tax=Haematococcus lacustris TaxID=44745 RepID=A0A699YQE5_HAELA|nr:uncharacterized protein HaLaN_08043 [Haematococcus lacustris]